MEQHDVVNVENRELSAQNNAVHTKQFFNSPKTYSPLLSPMCRDRFPPKRAESRLEVDLSRVQVAGRFCPRRKVWLIHRSGSATDPMFGQGATRAGLLKGERWGGGDNSRLYTEGTLNADVGQSSAEV